MTAIRTDGYVVISGALDAATLAAVRTAVDGAVASGGGRGTGPRGHHLDPRCARAGGRSRALRTTPAVVEAVAALLGPGPTAFSAVMRNPVGPTAQQALHVDWAGPVAPGRDQQAQAMFFLDDITADKRTHPPGAGEPPLGRDPAQEPRRHALAPPRRGVHYRPGGGCAVFSSHLWHSGTANTSGRPRRVITITYRRGR